MVLCICEIVPSHLIASWLVWCLLNFPAKMALRPVQTSSSKQAMEIIQEFPVLMYILYVWCFLPWLAFFSSSSNLYSAGLGTDWIAAPCQQSKTWVASSGAAADWVQTNLVSGLSNQSTL